MNPFIYIVFCSAFFLSACGGSSNTKVITYNAEHQVTSVPAEFSSSYKDYSVYTYIATPNGKKIHIFAQSTFSSSIGIEKVIRTKNVMKHYLANYKGSKHGTDKTAVMNKMGDNKSALLLIKGRDKGNSPGNGQPLYDEEIQLEGHDWYINWYKDGSTGKQNQRQHRDATFEEILHLVHDDGIGIDKVSPFRGALPDFQKEIRAAQVNAQAKVIWPLNATQSWVSDLTRENSLSQEYLAAVIDVYYGLWGTNDSIGNTTGTGMGNLYKAQDRSDITVEDSTGQKKILDNQFFHPYLTYNARIYEGFSGTFSLTFSQAKPYTHHSRYLKDITLLGTKNTDVQVNELNNHITGNAGTNTVFFNSSKASYTITTSTTQAIVTQKTTDSSNINDGKNTLLNIERIHFKSGELCEVKSLISC